MKNVAIFIKESKNGISDQVKNAFHAFSDSGSIQLYLVSNPNSDQSFSSNLDSSAELESISQNNNLLVFENTPLLLEIAGNVSSQLNCEIFSNVIEFNGDQVVCQAYSGKAKSIYQLNSNDRYILILSKSFQNTAGKQNAHSIETAEINKLTIGLGTSKGNVLKVQKNEAGISLVDAKFVVGAGRGMKDPSNWGIIEALAQKLGAGLACSKPVSDINWRPHHEHVGQTGIKIAPKLYIACGISGAIQHLAGVNGSEVIVVINNDPEAPFVKNADYAIIGDLFQVVPELLNNIN